MKQLMFAAALLTVLAVTVCAAGGAPTQQGSREFSGSFAWATASYSYEDEDFLSETALSLAPGFGYFVADGTELRFTFPISFWSYDYDDYYRRSRSDYSRTTYGSQLALLFHFGASESFVPYAGLGVGASWASDSEDDEYETVWILPSLHVGARSFFSESACLTTEFLYQHQSNAAYAEDVSANAFGLTAGLSVFF
ncbi:MAG: acyloxyacyl hydrolase [Candidatus Eisenbacteria sp.]|nr:acyloxyacyl hydrolase [Candidatus Eisenbacteria bacterium]